MFLDVAVLIGSRLDLHIRVSLTHSFCSNSAVAVAIVREATSLFRRGDGVSTPVVGAESYPYMETKALRFRGNLSLS